MSRRCVAIVGSTGSIGTSALDFIGANLERFEVDCLIAGRRGAVLADQVRRFRPRVAAASDLRGFEELCRELGVSSVTRRWQGTELVCGDDAITDVIRTSRADVVVAGVVGMAGLRGVVAAIEGGKDIALANKESLVVAGELVVNLARSRGVKITPVDSEHSAIFQALQGVRFGDLDSVILTASGGPFLHTPTSELASVTPERALKHPKWNMGAKISIDSATMMNKALEVIEARWLFDLQPDQIEVIVHPQSIIHSMVRLIDGSLLAQLSVPDMKGPIAYALTHPEARARGVMERLDLVKLRELTFLELERERFPAVAMAKECLRGSNGASAVLNAANEAAVELFLNKAIGFESINGVVRRAIDLYGSRSYRSLDELFDLTSEVVLWARQYASGIRV